MSIHVEIAVLGLTALAFAHEIQQFQTILPTRGAIIINIILSQAVQQGIIVNDLQCNQARTFVTHVFQLVQYYQRQRQQVLQARQQG